MNATAETLPEGVTAAALLKWRNRVHDAVGKIGRARVSYVMPTMGTGSPADELLFDAQEGLQVVNAALFDVAGRNGFPPPSAGDDERLDLSTLATFDTANARELLAIMERAQEVAERVDAERGRALPANIPLQPGESRGADLAEEISYLCFRLRGEVSPPTGRGE